MTSFGMVTFYSPVSWTDADHTLSGIIAPPRSKLLQLDDLPISRLSIGPGQIFADLKVNEAYNDNLVLIGMEEIDSFVTTISPHLGYAISGRKKQFVIDYTHQTGLHTGSSVDNYHDNRLRAGFFYDPTRKLSAEVHAEYSESHDGRGEGRAEAGTGTLQDSLDEFHRYGIEGRLAYGRKDARGRLELDLGYKSKHYDTNREFTVLRERDTFRSTGRFFYRVGPKTRALLQVGLEDFDYVDAAQLDGTTTRYLLGVDWERTYKTTGYFKLGFTNRTFDADIREDFTGFTWELGTIWRPRSYSTVRLSTINEITETNGTGDAIDSTITRLSWVHHWKQRLNTDVSALYAQDDFSDTNREDNIYSFELRVNYDMRRWLNLSAGYRRTDRQSNDNTFDFDQNVFDISAIFSL